MYQLIKGAYMKKTEIKIISVNPPTKEQADKRIKELTAYLEKIWLKPKNTG